MHKVFENSAWLMIDKVSKLFPGILVMAVIARHLGPEEFGIWNYAIALTTIVGSMALLGMDKVAVKELVEHEQEQPATVATVISMRVAAALVCMAISTGIVILSRPQQSLYLYCTLFAAGSIVLQSADVLDYFYQVKNDVKKVIIPKVSVFLFFCVVKMMVVVCSGTLITLLWVTLLESLVTFLVVIIVYSYNQVPLSVLNVQPYRAGRLLTQSWPLVFSSLLVMLFVKADLLLLDMLGSAAQLGAYVVAARISELWYAIPTVFATAMLPTLMRQKQLSREAYLEVLEKWLRLSFWSSLTIAVLVTLSAHIIIPLLYGAKYLSASPILMIHTWAGIPVFLSVAFVQYLIVEGKYKIYLYSNISGLVVNVGLNLLLIPSLGSIGAAIATVAAYTSVYATMVVLDKSGQGWMLLGKVMAPALVCNDLRQAYNRLKIFTGRRLYSENIATND